METASPAAPWQRRPKIATSGLTGWSVACSHRANQLLERSIPQGLLTSPWWPDPLSLEARHQPAPGPQKLASPPAVRPPRHDPPLPAGPTQVAWNLPCPTPIRWPESEFADTQGWGSQDHDPSAACTDETCFCPNLGFQNGGLGLSAELSEKPALGCGLHQCTGVLPSERKFSTRMIPQFSGAKSACPPSPSCRCVLRLCDLARPIFVLFVSFVVPSLPFAYRARSECRSRASLDG